jgi:hypothetical protein
VAAAGVNITTTLGKLEEEMSAKCCVCTDEFPGIDDLEAHISADHYNCLPFECEKCKFAKFPTEFAIKRHYEEDHGLMEYFVSDLNLKRKQF